MKSKTIQCFSCNRELKVEYLEGYVEIECEKNGETWFDDLELETEIEYDCGYIRHEYIECPLCGSTEEVDSYELDWDELTEAEQEKMEMWGYSPESIFKSYYENYDYDCYRDMQMGF